jgi:copper chaperone CopZ
MLRLVFSHHGGTVFRSIILGATLALATPALACPMADAAAFAAAADKVKASDGTKVTLMVDGMTCGSCSEKITGGLDKLDGVVAAAADYQTGRTEIAFDSGKTNAEDLVKAIEGMGFKARVEKSS